MNVYNRGKEKSRSTGNLVNAFALMHFPAGDDLSRGRVGLIPIVNLDDKVEVSSDR